MGLENEVPSRGLCKKWKEIGGRQDTIFQWVRFGFDTTTWSIRRKPSVQIGNREWFAAPLASELMEWLKKDMGDAYYDDEEKTWIIMPWVSEAGFEGYKDGKSPNALMKMAIEMEKEMKFKACPFCGAKEWEEVDRGCWVLYHTRACYLDETEITNKRECVKWNKREGKEKKGRR